MLPHPHFSPAWCHLSSVSLKKAMITMSASGSVPAGTLSLTHSHDEAVVGQWQRGVTHAQMAGTPALDHSLISLLLFREQWLLCAMPPISPHPPHPQPHSSNRAAAAVPLRASHSWQLKVIRSPCQDHCHKLPFTRQTKGDFLFPWV